MIMLVNAMIVLVVELFVCFVVGCAITCVLMKKSMGLCANTIVGFLSCQIIFEILTLICYKQEWSLTKLTIIWYIFLGGILILSMLSARKEIYAHIRAFFIKLGKNPGITIVSIVVILAVCYYVMINSQITEDSRYYIGIVNTTLSTDSLFKYNPYHGLAIDGIYLRRALATYEIHSAAICKVTGIHPLILTKVMRACENVLLFAMAVYLGAKVIFGESGEKKAYIAVPITLILQFDFAGSIFTNATFLLTRAYEGKAFSACVIALFAMYLSVTLVQKKEKKIGWIMLITLWGSAAISSSAAMVALAEYMIFTVPFFLYTKSKKKIKEDSNGNY